MALRRCTGENEHPWKRAPDHTTPAYSDTEAKFSSQTQPRKCAPTANLDTQLTAFCTSSAFCTRWSKPVAEFWLQTWLILRVNFAHFQIRISLGTKPVSCSLVFFILFSLRLFAYPKKCTRFRRLISQFMLIAHRQRWCHLQISCKYRCFISVLSCIAFSLRASPQNEK